MKKEKQLTIHEKWELDSKLPNGGINFEASECKGKSKDIIEENSTEAIRLLEKIYDDFDELNGHLFDLSEKLDSEKHRQFFRIWESFPTYSTLDDLKVLLKELKEEDN